MILKSPYPMGQLACLEKVTSVRGRGCPVQRGQGSKAPTDLLSYKSDNEDHKNPLGSNKLGPSEVFPEVETFAGLEAPARPPQAPLPTPQDLSAN